MQFRCPAFLEVSPDRYKAAVDCDYADAVSALALRTDRSTGRFLRQLIRTNGCVWLQFPRMTIGDMLKVE